MTCFWDGILTSIRQFNQFTISNNIELVNFMKSKNTKNPNVIVNDEQLTEQQMNENYDAINVFDVNSIHNGYLCSTCEPFLILLANIMQCIIYHKYMGVLIKYEFTPDTNIKKAIHFESNSSHFWFNRIS